MCEGSRTVVQVVKCEIEQNMQENSQQTSTKRQKIDRTSTRNEKFEQR